MKHARSRRRPLHANAPPTRRSPNPTPRAPAPAAAARAGFSSSARRSRGVDRVASGDDRRECHGRHRRCSRSPTSPRFMSPDVFRKRRQRKPVERRRRDRHPRPRADSHSGTRDDARQSSRSRRRARCRSFSRSTTATVRLPLGQSVFLRLLMEETAPKVGDSGLRGRGRRRASDRVCADRRRIIRAATGDAGRRAGAMSCRCSRA